MNNARKAIAFPDIKAYELFESVDSGITTILSHTRENRSGAKRPEVPTDLDAFLLFGMSTKTRKRIENVGSYARLIE